MRFESPGTKSDEERILPLINVVFLLLIFIMLAGRLAVSDPFRIDPPRSVSDAAAKARETTVSIGANGRLALDGEIMGQAQIREAVARGVSRGDTLRVLVKADGRCEAVRVVTVMALLREAGIESVTLLTLREER